MNPLSLISGVSQVKLVTYFAAILVALSVYYYIDELKDQAKVSYLELSISKLNTEIAELKGEVKSEKQKRQACLTDVSLASQRIEVLEKMYNADVKACRKLQKITEVRVERKEVQDRRLKEYADKNPSVFRKLDPELIKILNGEK